jgi:cob(I)alamin adenosyltransferase
LRIEAYGTVDELNAFLGLLADHDVNKKRYDFLKSIQDQLFVIGANLASDPEMRADRVPPIQTEEILALEKSMDEMDAQIPELRHFVLPGGHVAVSIAHVCRTICRRAERAVVRLAEHDEVPDLVGTFLNRLSDYFFVLSRKMCQELEVEEVKWLPGKK